MKANEIVIGQTYAAIAPNANASWRTPEKAKVLEVGYKKSGSTYNPSFSKQYGTGSYVKVEVPSTGDSVKVAYLPTSHFSGETWAEYEVREAKERAEKDARWKAKAEQTVKNEKQRDELIDGLRSVGVDLGSYAQFNFSTEKRTVTLSFEELEQLIAAAKKGLQ